MNTRRFGPREGLLGHPECAKGYLRILLALTLCTGLGFPGLPTLPCAAQSLVGERVGADWALSPTAPHRALRSNPALALAADDWSIRFAVDELFGLAELRPARAGLLMPIGGVQAFVGTQFLGLAGYREWKGSAGFAARLQGRSFGFGLRTDTHVLSIPGYDALTYLGLVAGWTARLNSRFTLLAHLDPLVRYVSRDDVRPEREVVAGCLFLPTDETVVSVSLGKSYRGKMQVRAGAETAPVEVMRLRVGYTTAPVTYGGGIGLLVDRWALGFGGSHHAWLGWSRSMSVSMRGL